MGAGLMKIMSKMGIATISSYRNSRLFDVIGLDRDVVKSVLEVQIGFTTWSWI